MEKIEFFVSGHPHPQPRPAIVRTTGHVYYPDKAGKLKRWRAAIRRSLPPGAVFGASLLRVSLNFTMLRPENHWLKRGGGLSTAGCRAARPAYDLDNFAKCVIDEMQSCGVLEDDSNIIELIVRKAWQSRLDDPPGCRIALARAFSAV